MRVRGNVLPKVLNIEKYEPIEGKVEVRLCENIVTFEQIDPISNETVTGYEYDEYTFILDDTKGLEKQIKANLEDWLTTGRTLEVDPKATLYVTAKSNAIDEYTEELVKEGLL